MRNLDPDPWCRTSGASTQARPTLASQFQWSYLDPQGRLHRIGIYHGPRSGHLLVYCDGRILFVDFGVFHDKVYPFFIEDQLCELHLIREGRFMRYEFKVNTEADTPLNKARHEAARRQRQWLRLRLVVGAVVGVLLVLLVLWGKWREDRRRVPDTVGTATVIDREAAPDGSAVLTYSWIVDGVIWQDTWQIEAGDRTDGPPLASLPLARGDELIVEWASAKPPAHRLRTDTLPPATADRLIERMADSLSRYSDTLRPCTIRAAWEAAGVEGLRGVWQAHHPGQADERVRRLWAGLGRQRAFHLAWDKYCRQ